MNLAIPLGVEQIKAASRLYARTVRWQRADRALKLLRERFPDFGAEATLLKAIALDALYGTNIHGIAQVAEFMEQTLAGTDLATAGAELVEALANVPISRMERRPRHGHTFASRFAHFFIDSERFPILDHYANEMLSIHLGHGQILQDLKAPYMAFIRNIERLETSAGVQVRRRSLDLYMLIAGQYRAFQQGRGAEIDAELRELFQAGCDELKILPT
jgi:hypothetical protein